MSKRRTKPRPLRAVPALEAALGPEMEIADMIREWSGLDRFTIHDLVPIPAPTGPYLREES